MNTVIYYPDAPTPEWLRLAALCWDHVYWFNFYGLPRIETSLAILDQALGGVLQFTNADEFKRRHPELTVRLHEWILSHAKGLGLDLAKLPNRYATDSSFGLGYTITSLYEGKVWDPDSIVLNYMYQLRHSRLSSERKLIEREQQVVVAQAEGLYAVAAAEADGRDVSTTNDKYTEAIFHHERVLRGEVAQAVLKACVPAKILSMDPAQIATLRNELSIKRLKFQKEIDKLCADFVNVSSVDRLGYLKNQIVEIAHANVENTKTTYKNAGGVPR